MNLEIRTQGILGCVGNCDAQLLSLSPLPFTQLELQRWGAVVVPALQREGGSGWAEPRAEESPVDWNVSE